MTFENLFRTAFKENIDYTTLNLLTPKDSLPNQTCSFNPWILNFFPVKLHMKFQFECVENSEFELSHSFLDFPSVVYH